MTHCTWQTITNMYCTWQTAKLASEQDSIANGRHFLALLHLADKEHYPSVPLGRHNSVKACHLAEYQVFNLAECFAVHVGRQQVYHLADTCKDVFHLADKN